MCAPRTFITLDQLVPLRPQTRYWLPLFAHLVPAGFASPADNYLERRCDVHDLCVRSTEDTRLMRMPDSSLLREGIDEGDLLIIDRGRQPTDGKIVVVRLGEGYTVRQIRYARAIVVLLAAHADYEPLYLHEGDDAEVVGVVTFVIQPVHPPARLCRKGPDWPRPVGDLNQHCIADEALTFFARVRGESMVDDRIRSGDVLIVDSTAEAQSGQVVLAWLNEAQLVKRLHQDDSGTELRPSNPHYAPIRIEPTDRLRIVGVVSFVIHKR